MVVRGAKVAVALAQCKLVEADTTIDNGAGQIPWAKTPIYLVSAKELPEFLCSHTHWIGVFEVYQNVPTKKPTC